MTKARRHRAEIGDVFEIVTPAGLAYFQYTHQHHEMGGLIRVLPGIFARRPGNLTALTQEREQFVVFFPLRAAANKGTVEFVTHTDVPEHAATFPLFREGGPDVDGQQRDDDWWLWDGQRSWPVGSLSREHRHIPIKEIWNDTLLATRIAKGWTPDLQ